MLQLLTHPLHRDGARLAEGPLSLVRQFSVAQLQAVNTRQPNTHGRVVLSGSALAARSHTGSQKPNLPSTNLNPRNTNTERPRPRRIIDARSLAASRAAGKPTNIIRGPRIRPTPGGLPARARIPGVKSKATASKDRKRGSSSGSGQSATETADLLQEAAVNDVYRELAEQTRPKPIRYEPEPVSLASLKETWPSLPTDVGAHTAGMVEKLSSFSDRFANGYVPPNELGRRLFRGKFVRFMNEKEKSEAIMEANKLSQECADRLSQRKGDLLDPNPINFNPISTQDQNVLMGLVVQGNYPKSVAERGAKLSVVEMVSENLRNNATYQTAGKSSAFMEKLDSLLASGRGTTRI
ncbi:hypothetical protein BO70DRAFT_124000 [Aspergillus heteromorphus CBS 117.55]|uniref:Uncharacterized protein n=1 Tax=Aspergillus heteromorphus CBS 117.55 TaxID=1448321 RepID=A0A317VDZ8_9EURO|nr:uncharacterized protein BO70DRAFT_124000 [Aspergillus heteromorphus CBS 117.55]PWY71491.1 hypothetical protein BO70DRAFT_124000 [Aspergillus heteromorphus CBS 117.55]